MARNHFTYIRWRSYFLPTRNKVKIVKCNLILIYVMCWKIYHFGKIPWMRVGTFFLKIFYLKKNELSLQYVIHDSYSLYVYLNHSVISIAVWFPHTLFPVGLCYYTCWTYFGAFSFLFFVSFSFYCKNDNCR